MSKINKDNYEAYFLDFVENNISAEDSRLLDAFLSENPELREELEGFEIIPLPAEASRENWNGIKKDVLSESKTIQSLTANSGLRDELYFSAIEKTASTAELALLDTLRTNAKFDKEFKLWQRIILHADEEKYEKATLYQFGLERELSDFNYDYYLVARTEGLLTDLQNRKLELFAMAKPQGKRDLELADNLKLKAATGIFYPDKAGLRKEEKAAGILWIYRAAAIAAILLLGVFVWNTYQNTDAPAVADVKKEMENKQRGQGEKENQGKDNFAIDTLKANPYDRGRDSMDKSATEEPNLQEWEVREPDVAEYAETIEKKNAQDDAETRHEIAPEVLSKEMPEESIEKREMEMAETQDPSEIQLPTIQKENLQEQAPKKQKPGEKFKTLPEFAEDALARGLDIPDDERDAMALAIARRITERAGALLDTDITKETTGDEGSESLTYSLRIGNFKMSHSKTK